MVKGTSRPPYSEGMARSPFTLAAAVTAALPGTVIVGVRRLSADGDGRFDSAVVSLDGGAELVIRVANDHEAARELAAEALALRALTAGARAMLPFGTPSFLGQTTVGEAPALVTELMAGYQIEAAHIPPGPGAAHSAGAALARIHALPASVVRTAGLMDRSATESRAELRGVIDRAASTGRVPARLIVRWRGTVDDDDLWRFESCVTLGGAQATSFIFEDDPASGPFVNAVIGWHGLRIGDPSADLAWLSRAPQAEGDVYAAYQAGVDRGADAAILPRARLRAELEFARWLLHGQELHRDDIIDDASSLLEALAESIREDDLAVIADREQGSADAVESALGAAERLPAAAEHRVDTSMQTDAYTAESLWIAPHPDPASHATARDSPSLDTPSEAEEPESEAQRAARAALQRWRSSASE